MKAKDLPDNYKYWILKTTDDPHIITGEEREAFLNSKEDWVVLRNGNALNKSFCKGIVFDEATTTEKFRELPEAQQLKLTQQLEKLRSQY